MLNESQCIYTIQCAKRMSGPTIQEFKYLLHGILDALQSAS